MIIKEFDQIIAKQQEYYPEIFTPENIQLIKEGSLKKTIEGKERIIGYGIFCEKGAYQSAIEEKIGYCCYLPEAGTIREKRIAIASNLFQEKRLLEQINNLRIYQGAKAGGEAGDGKLTLAQRDLVYENMLEEKEAVKGNKIGKWLNLASNSRLNIDASGKKKSEQVIQPHVILATIKKTKNSELFATWQSLSAEAQDYAVKLLHDEGELDANMKAWVEEFPDFPPDWIETLQNIILPRGYAATGTTATSKLIAELRADVITHYKAEIRAKLKHPTSEPTEDYLPYYGRLPSLEHYCQGASKHPAEPLEKQFGKIPNSVVHQSLNKIRKILNTYIKEYGPPQKIHLELARELNKSLKERENEDKKNQKNQKKNTKYNDKILTYRDRTSRKYRRALKLHEWQLPKQQKKLYKEQKCICPYSGTEISIDDIFTGKAEIDHILPYSQTMLDNISNLVLCTKEANSKKKKQTPYEAFSGGYPDGTGRTYDDILTTIADYPEYKKKKFNEDAMAHFKNKNLFATRFKTDTQYLAKVVHNYLGCLKLNPINQQQDEKHENNPESQHDAQDKIDGEVKKKRIICLSGGITADLRHHWGLGNILQNFEQDSLTSVGREEMADNINKDFLQYIKTRQIDLQKQAKKKVLDEAEQKFLAINLAELQTNQRGDWDDYVKNIFRDRENKAKKNRLDYRHHFIDAIVIACTNASEVNRLNAANANYRNQKTENTQSFYQQKQQHRIEHSGVKKHPLNWVNFCQDVKDYLRAHPNLIVQNPNFNSASRQIHEETNYRKIIDIYTQNKTTQAENYLQSLVSSRQSLDNLVAEKSFDALLPKKEDWMQTLRKKNSICKSPIGDRPRFSPEELEIEITKITAKLAVQAEIKQFLEDKFHGAKKEKRVIYEATKDKLVKDKIVKGEPEEEKLVKTSVPEQMAWAITEYKNRKSKGEINTIFGRKYFTIYKYLTVIEIRNKSLETDLKQQRQNIPTRPQRVVVTGNNSHSDIFYYYDDNGARQIGWECIAVIAVRKADYQPAWRQKYPKAKLIGQLRINDTLQIWNNPDPEAPLRKRILVRVQKMSKGYISFSHLQRSKTENMSAPYRKVSSIGLFQAFAPKLVKRDVTGKVYYHRKLY